MPEDYKMWLVNAKIGNWSFGGSLSNWYNNVSNESDIKKLMKRKAKEFGCTGDFDVFKAERIR